MSCFEMRWFRHVGFLVLAVAVMLAGCTGDDGQDGADGAQGPMGPSGTATCMNCHTDTYDVDNYLLTYVTEYATSLHATGETYVRKSGDCSRCHTTEGFQAYIATGEGATLSQSSHIGCFACHAPHTNEDFDLVVSGPTDLEMADDDYDKGASNICANCHQGRAPSPAVDSADPITSIRWGAHHGPQANILAGVGLWEIGGETYSSGHMHNTQIDNGCVGCHMAAIPASGNAGGHSWKVVFEYHGAEEVNANGCVACHTDWDDETAYEAVEEAKAEFDAKLATLKELLIAKGWLDADDYVVVATAPTDPDDRGAVLNYNMLREDRSGGIHNPTYANAAIDAAIAHVQGD